MSDTPERIWLLWREIGLAKGRVTCSEQDHTDEGFPEYIRADLHEAERARAEKAETERDALAEKLARARDDALKEAAQVAERCDVYSSAALRQRIASAIRAEITRGGNE